MNANHASEMRRNPYVGPQPFQRKDKDFFFGRSLEASQLLALVLSERIVLFYAQSGAGKSSLINANLVDTLENEYDFFVLPVVRVSGKGTSFPESQKVENVFIANLMHDINDKTTTGDKPVITPGMTLSEYLRLYTEQIVPSKLSRVEYVEGFPKILIIDQFEELFTSYPEEWKKRDEFFIQLRQALDDDPRLRIILTLREDFVAAIDPYAYIFPGRLRARFYIQRLGENAAKEAISKPAEVAGRKFDPIATDELVHRLRHLPSENLEAELQDQFIEPLILQAVCYDLWENLADKPFTEAISLTDLKIAGDVDLALTKYYDKWVIERLLIEDKPDDAPPLEELTLRQWIEKNLLSRELQRNFVYEKDAGLPTWALHSLYERRLLCQGRRDERIWYELAHDRLIQPVHLSNSQWLNQMPLLRTVDNWVRDGKPDDYLVRGKQLEDYKDWAQKNKALSDPEVALFLERSRYEEDDQKHKIDLAQKDAIAEMRRIEVQKRLKQRNLYNILLFSIFIILGLALVMYFLRQSTQDARETRYDLSKRVGVDSQEISAGQPLEKLIEAVQALRITSLYDDYESSDARHAVYDALASTVLYQPIIKLGKITMLAVSPSGRLAVSTTQQVSVWGEMQLYQAVNQALGSPPPAQYTLDIRGEISSLAFSVDGWLAAGGLAEGAGTRLWELSGDDPGANPLDLPNPMGGKIMVKFSPDGRWLAAAGHDGVVQLWDRTDLSAKPFLLSGHEGAVNNLDFSSNNYRWLATGGDDGRTILWDLKSADPSRTGLVLPDHGAAITALAFNPDGRWLATGNGDGIARLWDTDADDPRLSAIILPGHSPQSPINTLTFHRNGQWLATASDDQTVCLWYLKDLPRLNCDPRLTGHSNSVLALAFDPDEVWLASGDADGGIWLWSGSTNHSQPLAHIATSIIEIVFDPARNWIATLGVDGSLFLWEIQYSPFTTLPVMLPDVGSRLNNLMVSPDEHWLIGLDPDGLVNGWQIENIQTNLGHLTPYQSLAEQALLADSMDTLSGEEAQNVSQAVFYPTGRWLATGAQSGNVSLWDLEQVKPISSKMGGDLISVNSLAFNPSGDLLAAGGAVDKLTHETTNNAIQLWRISTIAVLEEIKADPLKPLPVDTPTIYRIAFSQDSRWLAAGGEAGFLRLWELENGQPVAEPTDLLGHQMEVQQLVFTPNGEWLVSGDLSGQILTWNLNDLRLPPGDLLKEIRQQTNPAELSGQSDYLGGVNGLAASSDGRWLAITHSFLSLVWLVDISAARPATGMNSMLDNPNGEPAQHSLDCGRSNANGLSFIMEKTPDDSPDKALVKRIKTVLGFDDVLPTGADRWLAIAYDDGGICIWDLRDPESAPIILNDETQDFTAIATSPQGDWLASVGSNGRVQIWPLSIRVIDDLACLTLKDSLGDQPRNPDIQQIYTDCFPPEVRDQ